MNGVMRCLFLKIEGRIGAVRIGSKGEPCPMRFRGELFTDYSENYWNEWINQAGYVTNQLADLCFISDDGDWQIPLEINCGEIDPKTSCWNRSLIIGALLKICHGEYRMDVKTRSGAEIFSSELGTRYVELIAVFPNDGCFSSGESGTVTNRQAADRHSENAELSKTDDDETESPNVLADCINGCIALFESRKYK